MCHCVRINESNRRFREFCVLDKGFQFVVNGIGLGFRPPRRYVRDTNVVQGGCNDADADTRLHVSGHELECHRMMCSSLVTLCDEWNVDLESFRDWNTLFSSSISFFLNLGFV